MLLTLYRSKVHATYPDESMWYCYAFEPIPAQEQDRDGRLMSWTDNSGMDPYAVIDVPEGSMVTRIEECWQLQVPGRHAVIEAEEVYELALNSYFGLSVVQEAMVTEDQGLGLL
jgi:hypothetical protein